MKYTFIVLALLFSFNAFAEVMITNDDDVSYIVILDCDSYSTPIALSESSSQSFELPGDGCKAVIKSTRSYIYLENNTTYLVDNGQLSEE